MIRFLEGIGYVFLRLFEQTGLWFRMLWRTIVWTTRPPFEIGEWLRQMVRLGVETGDPSQPGLLPTSQWIGGADVTAEGIEYMPNLPTEEVFTAPDPERARGTVRSTMPLVVYGATIEGLRLRFDGGRAVEIDADKGAETIRALTTRDANASRLGEVALVDREGRIGTTGTVFYDTLLDENAASHIALGDAYQTSVEEEDRPRVNRSELHLDFMIGGPEVVVTAATREGERVPVLREGAWQI